MYYWKNDHTHLASVLQPAGIYHGGLQMPHLSQFHIHAEHPASASFLAPAPVPMTGR